MAPWKIELTPWPYWSQLHDWTADGQQDENRIYDCGPECVAMVLKYLTGVELPADYIKDVMKGEGYVGYTSVDDLRGFLQRYCETPCEVITVSSQQQLLWHEWRYLVRGRPLIGLFSFSAPGAADGHFRAVMGMDPWTMVTADPWTGSRRVESHGEHWAWSKSCLLGIQRHRALGR
jgi:hypothetical protein